MIKLRAYIQAVIFVICYVISGSASADIYWHIDSDTATFSGDPSGACSAWVQKYSPGSVFTGLKFYSNYPGDGMPNKYWCMRKNSNGDPNAPPEAFMMASRHGSGCTAPAVLVQSTGTCKAPESCIAGYVKDAEGKCVPKEPLCKAGEKWVVVSAYGSVPKNHGGCAITIVQLLQCYTTSTTKYCKWEVERTGEKAAADVPDSAPPAGSTPPPIDGPRVPSPPMNDPTPGKGCPLGTVQAGQTESGTPICIGSGTNTSPGAGPSTSTSTSSAPTTVTDAAGNTVTTQKTTVTNADGSTTTTNTVTTVKVDGTKEVSASNATSPAPSGASGVSDSSKKEMGFCEQNPTLTICKTSTVSGSCGQVSCSGDAIQCATLRAAAAMECRDKEATEIMKSSPSTALGDQILAGQDPQKGQLDALIKGIEVDMSSPNLDKTGFLGGGQCLAPLSFAVLGKPVSYSFDTLCGHIQPLRFLIMVICSILSYLVVARSVVGGS